MSKRASEDLMDELHSALAKEMVQWIAAGELSPAQASVIVKFLKDNDITGVPINGSPLASLAGLIPELTFEDTQRGYGS